MVIIEVATSVRVDVLLHIKNECTGGVSERAFREAEKTEFDETMFFTSLFRELFCLLSKSKFIEIRFSQTSDVPY